MKRIMFVIVLAAMLIATTGTASAGITRIDFKGVTDCKLESLVFRKEWMAGPVYQARHITEDCYDVASIPQMNGVEHIDFHIVGSIPIFAGTDRMETNEGGVWVGSWVWPPNTSIIKIIMHGEGKYAGLQLHMFEDASTDEFWGYIEVTPNSPGAETLGL